ncbi:hypothetical protein C8J57DRAFT_1475203 [Mycena rebaudengoi]|nr:hypothetical protein C8J57DRAFT_1475203 [Mycena rebaudengoi]
MSLGPVPLFWCVLLFAYSTLAHVRAGCGLGSSSRRAIRVESGRQRLYFRSASLLMRVHLGFISLLAAPHAASARRGLHEGTLLSRARSRRRSDPDPGTSQGGTRMESGRSLLYFRVDSFLVRVYLSLMSFDHWEGRAVAFVLSCGLGVLLRVVLRHPRLIPCRPLAQYAGMSNEDEFFDAEEIFVAPPLYTTFLVEKSEVADAAVIVKNKSWVMVMWRCCTVEPDRLDPNRSFIGAFG